MTVSIVGMSLFFLPTAIAALPRSNSMGFAPSWTVRTTAPVASVRHLARTRFPTKAHSHLWNFFLSVAFFTRATDKRTRRCDLYHLYSRLRRALLRAT